jgi:hypothetical protein
MPLPPPAVPRKHIHTRRIVCEAYEREDGLWDVEANMTDVKSYDTERGSAGEPLHNMWVRLTLDTTFVIHGIESAMDAYPQAICPQAVNPMKELVGVKIGARLHASARIACANGDHGDAGDGRRAAQPRHRPATPGQGHLLRKVRRDGSGAVSGKFSAAQCLGTVLGARHAAQRPSASLCLCRCINRQDF